MCNFVQNFTQIGQSVVEIYRQKCIFQYDVRVPYQILKFWVLVKYILLWSQTQSATVYRILSKSDYSMFQWNMVIKWFSRWQSYSHFEYSEFEICGIWPWLLSDFMSSYKSSSVAELCPKRRFPIWRPSAILNLKIWIVVSQFYYCYCLHVIQSLYNSVYVPNFIIMR